jgi:hypothetical protein
MKSLPRVVLSLLLFTGPAFARPQPDSEIRGQIIQESIADYKATGHPCACPYDTARNGSSCGLRSAYSKPGGAEPLCYPSDVTDGMVADWKHRHPSQ